MWHQKSPQVADIPTTNWPFAQHQATEARGGGSMRGQACAAWLRSGLSLWYLTEASLVTENTQGQLHGELETTLCRNSFTWTLSFTGDWNSTWLSHTERECIISRNHSQEKRQTQRKQIRNVMTLDFSLSLSVFLPLYTFLWLSAYRFILSDLLYPQGQNHHSWQFPGVFEGWEELLFFS